MTDPSAIEQRKILERERGALAFVGLRAQGTATGLIQLCAELRCAGVLGDDAIERIKQAIVDDLIVSSSSLRRSDEIERAMKRRLDDVFARRIASGAGRQEVVGTADRLGESLGLSDEGPADR